ncbi:hypothetical protein RRG08_025816 [Elysia crispata]|uniref:Uncharacterized protein n=1 Tax=Elysia crispata TaxID=231223 RepID=A0AAE0Y3Z5_9GAST|nr:hypothetical protein RRG08_025816 [Elysia crispata]
MTNYDHSSAAKTTSIICQKAVRGVVRGLEQWLLSTNNVVGALISVLDLIDSTRVYTIGARPSTAMDIGQERSSVHFLSDVKWRAQQLRSTVHGEDKRAIGVSNEQKFDANSQSDEKKQISPISLNSGSSSMSRSKRDTSDSSSCTHPVNLPESGRAILFLKRDHVRWRVHTAGR